MGAVWELSVYCGNGLRATCEPIGNFTTPPHAQTNPHPRANRKPAAMRQRAKIAAKREGSNNALPIIAIPNEIEVVATPSRRRGSGIPTTQRARWKEQTKERQHPRAPKRATEKRTENRHTIGSLINSNTYR